MPTYEYRCRDCGHGLEVYQSFSDDPLTVCPSCGGSLRKLFGNVGISFKGSGFYKTDHGSRSGKSSESNGSGSSDTKSDTKSETKAEPKSESKATSAASTA
jgi:putative FmdB family regulatory protein